MKRLTLEELKAQKGNVVANLEAICGGDAEICHLGSCNPLPSTIMPADKTRVVK